MKRKFDISRIKPRNSRSMRFVDIRTPWYRDTDIASLKVQTVAMRVKNYSRSSRTRLGRGDKYIIPPHTYSVGR